MIIDSAILTRTLLEISDTNVGHINIAIFFWQMMSREDRFPLTQQTLDNGLAHTGVHLLAVQCVELEGRLDSVAGNTYRSWKEFRELKVRSIFV